MNSIRNWVLFGAAVSVLVQTAITAGICWVIAAPFNAGFYGMEFGVAWAMWDLIRKWDVINLRLAGVIEQFEQQ